MQDISVDALQKTIAWLCIAIAVLSYAAFSTKSIKPSFFFLDVGQGDATLFTDDGTTMFLTDAGPDSKVASAIGNILPATRRYIDVVVITHPQLDHFGGLNTLLASYNVGVFLYNGRDADGEGVAWHTVKETLAQKHIPMVVLARGDKIHHGQTLISILNPTPDVLASAEVNDSSVVEHIETGGISALLTGDIDSRIEQKLLHGGLPDIDVLKVAHHGAATATTQEFLRATTPRVAFIEYGVGNTYGHPSPQVRARLKNANTHVFQTGRDGTVQLVISSPPFSVFAVAQPTL